MSSECNPALAGHKKRHDKFRLADIEQLEARAYLSVSFPSSDQYGIGGRGSSFPVVVDLNRDGIPDIAEAVNSGPSGQIAVMLGKGDGTFSAPISLPAGQRPFQVIAGDFNGDGIQDLVVTNAGDGTIGFYAGNGDGTFKAPVSTSYGDPTTDATDTPFIAADDLNGDGHPDLIITGAIIAADAPQEKQMVVMICNGDGTFRRNETIAGDFGNIVTGSFRDNGTVDVATMPKSGFAIDVFQDTGEETLSATPEVVGNDPGFTGSSSGYSLAVGDFNDDGEPDLATVTDGTSGAPGTLRVFINVGDQTFSQGIATSIPGNPTAMAATDFNGDGISDAIVTNGSNLQIYAGNTDGTFQATPLVDLENISVIGGPVIANLDTDINPDIITTGSTSDLQKYPTGNTINVMIEGKTMSTGGTGGGGTSALTPKIAGKLPKSAIAGQKSAIKQSVTLTNTSSTFYDANAAGHLFLSADATVDANSIELPQAISHVVKLKVGKHTTLPFSVKSLPSTIPAGTYHLIAQVTDGSGNTAVAASTQTIAIAPPEIDFAVTLPKFISSAKGGKKFTETIHIVNSGNITAKGALPILVETSSDGMLADATMLTTLTKPINLHAGKSANIALKLTAPASGTSAFLIFQLDPTNNFKDINLLNNTVVSPAVATFG